MSRVFIPQEPMRKNDQGEWVPMMNLDVARKYGELVVCCPPGRVALSPAPVSMRLMDVLRDFGDDDYILAVGAPQLIAAVAARASANNRGKFRMLVWDTRSKDYIQTDWDINQVMVG